MELGENIFRYITYPASFYIKQPYFLKQKRGKYIFNNKKDADKQFFVANLKGGGDSFFDKS